MAEQRYTVTYKAERSQYSSSTIHGWWVLAEDDKPITGFLEREWAERIAAALNQQERTQALAAVVAAAVALRSIIVTRDEIPTLQSGGADFRFGCNGLIALQIVRELDRSLIALAPQAGQE